MEQNNNQNNYAQQQPPMRPPIIPQQRRTKNKFFTFFTALIPGTGQMYHGLIKKGLSIMAIFWGIIAVSVLLYVPVVCFALPIVWFYSFFDAVNRMNMPISELQLIKDDYVLTMKNMPSNPAIKNILKKRNLWIGWTLTILGIYSIFKMSIERFYNFMEVYYPTINYWALHNILNIIPTLIVPVICIVIGVKIIKSNIKKISNELHETQDTAISKEE